jgi:enamine deaminase RidA (YjgF/YER057c/UK114 family)
VVRKSTSKKRAAKKKSPARKAVKKTAKKALASRKPTKAKPKKRPAKEAIWPGLEAGVPKPLMPYSPAIRAGDWVFIAGQIASDFQTGLAPEVLAANSYIGNELSLQSKFVLTNLANTIKASGCDINHDMVRMWQWLVSEEPSEEAFAWGDNWPAISLKPYLNVRDEIVKSPAPPSSYLGVRELLCFGTALEVDMICLDDGNKPQIIKAPRGVSTAGGGHAVGMRRGDWVFLSAENAADLMDDEFGPTQWHDDPVERQTEHILDKLEVIAKEAGSSLAKAVKADVYIGHPDDFAAMDRVWKRRFPKSPPARVVIPYMGMGERGSRVEVALTLLTNNAKTKTKTINTSNAPKPLGHEPQAVKAGDLLFFSTQMAFDSNGNLPDGMIRHPSFPWYGSPGQAQMRYMMKNIGAICEAAGTTVDNICRRVCFHDDFQWFAESIEEWASYFPDDKPASTTIRLGGPFVVPGANTLLDLIAYAPD